MTQSTEKTVVQEALATLRDHEDRRRTIHQQLNEVDAGISKARQTIVAAITAKLSELGLTWEYVCHLVGTDDIPF